MASHHTPQHVFPCHGHASLCSHHVVCGGCWSMGVSSGVVVLYPDRVARVGAAHSPPRCPSDEQGRGVDIIHACMLATETFTQTPWPDHTVFIIGTAP
jgi:hypothetical protein